MMKKVLIIEDAMVSRAPHVEMYIHHLESANVTYDVAVWNRKGDDLTSIPQNYIVYNHTTKDDYPAWRKIIELYRFNRFVKKHIDIRDYSCIIIFEIANSLLFYHFLNKHFYKNYIFDIRDYSPICKLSSARYYLEKLVRNSYATMISSNGFKHWLPKDCNYLLSHNIDDAIFDKYYGYSFKPFNEEIILLTIGNLRDPNINCKIANALGNKKNVHLKYVGDGSALPVIKSYCALNAINNVSFHGHYKKSDEMSFYEKADMINCCMEDNMLSNYLMSNRIYLSVLLRKPILCMRGSFQSSVIDKYNLGLVLDDISNIKERMQIFFKCFNVEQYEKSCMSFLKQVKKDQILYKTTLFNMIFNSNNPENIKKHES